MEKRTLLAIVLSLLVLVVYQWFFVPKPNVKPPATQQTQKVPQNEQQTIKQNIQIGRAHV